jgi:hypothetical protein
MCIQFDKLKQILFNDTQRKVFNHINKVNLLKPDKFQKIYEKNKNFLLQNDDKFIIDYLNMYESIKNGNEMDERILDVIDVV